MNEKKKLRKVFVIREVEVDSLIEVRKGEVFRLEPADEADRLFENGAWYKASHDGSQPKGKEQQVYGDEVGPMRCVTIDQFILERG